MFTETITISVETTRGRELGNSDRCSLRPAADLSDPREREDLSPAAIREYLRIAERWRLTENQVVALLGGIAASTWHDWRAKPEGKKLDQDTLTRISLVIGIYRALHAYFGDPWADTWITNGNRDALFGGRPPLDYIIREGLPGLIQVRRLIEGWGAAGH